MACCLTAQSHYLNQCLLIISKVQWHSSEGNFTRDDLLMTHVINVSVNSSPPCATYMHQWIGSALVQLTACCIFSTKPLSKPMVGYCQLDPKEWNSVKFWSIYKTFHSWKCIWKYHLWNGSEFGPGRDELTHWSWDKIDAISQTTFSRAFSWMKML